MGSPRKYKSNFLHRVLVRIDFGRPVHIESKGPPKDIAKGLDSFPVTGLDIKTQKMVTVSIDAEPRERTHEVEEWTYRSKSGHKRAVMSQSAFYIEYSRFSNYSALKKEFQKAIAAIGRVYPDAIVKRLGLRYVNHITMPNEARPNIVGQIFDGRVAIQFQTC